MSVWMMMRQTAHMPDCNARRFIWTAGIVVAPVTGWLLLYWPTQTRAMIRHQRGAPGRTVQPLY
ncbi:hypothetical protein BIFGAL_03132 [Bifidobacterium gallicum DSM 20093 = LMG 11596]|uniref:Uncharacterized protein n=1 Tax=Bifidobacterium gallicum DSM 20093 = LMG 11596 TaxID=561180 RepID=D1NTH4_9BIFI|nr:hypothetical protein BIFGAL_03132 [Bifidobacterium gallicum DSM 20093 = LMG 11596]